MAKYRINQTRFRHQFGQWEIKQYYPDTPAGVIDWMTIGGCPEGSTVEQIKLILCDPDADVSFCATIFRDYGFDGKLKVHDLYIVDDELQQKIKDHIALMTAPDLGVVVV